MNSRYKGIVPYLFYDDAEAAIEWYTRVFDFEEIGRWKDDDGRVQNAEMRVGTTMRTALRPRIRRTHVDCP